MAKERIQQELADVPAEHRISIFTTNPLGAAEGGAPEALLDRADADIQAVVDRIRVSDAPLPGRGCAVGLFDSARMAEQDFGRVLFVTDRPVTYQPMKPTLGPPGHPSEEGSRKIIPSWEGKRKRVLSTDR